MQVCWDVQCNPVLCGPAASTSVLYFVGFYSQQSPAPNSLDLEYGFTTFVAPGCNFVQLWDGDSVNIDTKESVCASFLMGQDTGFQTPGFELSFSVADICNNLYGFGAGTMCLTIHEDFFCPGVTYDVMIWEIEVNVPPNAPITPEDIACLDLYVDESAPAVVQSAFTFPGTLSPIAPPQIVISGTCFGDGTYTGTTNPITLNCTDTVTFDYSVTPGCNFTESVAAYFDVNSVPTFGGGATHPFFWGLDVDDWFIFFANNIVDNQGNPIPYVGINTFASFTVPVDQEICIMAQDPCNGSSAITCVQFQNLTYTDPVADFDTTRTENCDSLVVDFLDLSTDTDGWCWDFGDGDSSTLQHPTHTYTSPGTYTVTLTAKDTADCTGDCTSDDVFTMQVVFDPPVPDAVADFGFTATGCDSLVVDFTNLSTGHTGSFWDFDDGSNSTLEDPTHVYTIPGSYEVMLIAQDTEYCMEPDTFTMTVDFDTSLNTVTAMGMGVPTSGTTVQFTSNSINCDMFEWDFGDGNTSTDENPVHTYAQPGDYVVTLICWNDCDSDTVVINLAVTGLEGLLGSTHALLFPNPTKGLITLELDGGMATDLRMTLHNALGQVLMAENIAHNGKSSSTYDLSRLPGAVYWLTVRDGAESISFKLLKE